MQTNFSKKQFLTVDQILFRPPIFNTANALHENLCFGFIFNNNSGYSLLNISTSSSFKKNLQSTIGNRFR